MSESTEAPVSDRSKGGGGHAAHDDEHHSANEYPFVQHHFDTPAQQLEAGKLGIWLFLATEILFFAGLFCAYTIYRAKYPEVFYWAHYYLDTKLGAANTIVLILSSLTAAWAVRNAQLGQQKQLITNIVITIACACTFMGIKYVEYSHKAHEGLLPGAAFDPKHELWENEDFKAKHPESAEAVVRIQAELEEHKKKLAAAAQAPAPAAPAPAAAAAPAAEEAPHGAEEAQGAEEPEAAADAREAGAADDVQPSPEAEAAAAPAAAEEAKTASADAQAPSEGDPAAGDAAAETAAAAVPAVEKPVSEAIFLANAIRKLPSEVKKPLVDAGIIRPASEGTPELSRPERAHMFFSVYFFMTGLHGLHVLIGIIVWVWLLLRAMKGQFGPLYFGPIDFAALYWHLVDLIWIYLFPLLYLIH
jgi:cytochrome c oxidase subunit 3